MSDAHFEGMTLLNTDVKGIRVVRSFKISEAFAMRKLQYRNGFTLRYRNLWPSMAWTPRVARRCPWWAFPRCKAVSYEQWDALRLKINERRAS